MTKRKEICENCVLFGPEATALNQFNDPVSRKVTKKMPSADCHLLSPRNLVVGPASAKVISMPSQTLRTYWCRYFEEVPEKPKKT